MADEQATTAPRQSGSVAWLLFPVGIGLALAAAVYLATQVITPDINTSLFGQRAADALALKAWLATGVLALAAFQLYSAVWIYGRMPWRKPGWLGRAHRASGYAAIVLSLPIAYHCLFAYGFRDFDRRTVVHSIAGCFFYGALAAKLIVVRSRRLPGWALPVAGGTMVTLVVVLWYSAALWYFNNFDSPALSSTVNVVHATYPGYPKIAAGPSGTTPMPASGLNSGSGRRSACRRRRQAEQAADRPDRLLDRPVGGGQPLLVGVKLTQGRGRRRGGCQPRPGLVDRVQHAGDPLSPGREHDSPQAAVKQPLRGRGVTQVGLRSGEVVPVAILQRVKVSI